MNPQMFVERMQRPHALPQASNWWTDWHVPFALQWDADYSTPLAKTILEMRAAGIVPVCKLVQPLPRGRYRFILTRRQLERIIAFHYGVAPEGQPQ